MDNILDLENIFFNGCWLSLVLRDTQKRKDNGCTHSAKLCKLSYVKPTTTEIKRTSSCVNMVKCSLQHLN